MKSLILAIYLMLPFSLVALEDVNCPVSFIKLDGVPTNYNTSDVHAGNPLDGEMLALYLDISQQTGLERFTLLHSRFDELPKKVAFSASGEGCPFGLVSYCKDIRWAHKTKSGRWKVERKK
jgi:hypothetical protein